MKIPQRRSPLLIRWLGLAALVVLTTPGINAQTADQTVVVTASSDSVGGDLNPTFLGLSFETSLLLPENGHYYFDPANKALINTFQTLGIKSLRVGGNAVDDPKIGTPQESDIDVFFNFARAAGQKVIYSFRLKNGNPADSARLAGYIMAHHADVLDAFAIGNEPDFFFPTYAAFYTAWRTHYDAILQAVPDARFVGPSVVVHPNYAIQFAHDMSLNPHLAMVTNHYYLLGSGRKGEKDPADTRKRFLAADNEANYAKAYSELGALLAADHAPYRIDELNNCYDGGSKGASDTYAATLWALDCTHWWAQHHIQGMNYHTGETVGRDGGFATANYASFIRTPDHQGFTIRPQGYSYLAFTQAAHGRPMAITINPHPDYNLNAYGYQAPDGSVYVTLINESYGPKAQDAAISLVIDGITPASISSLALTQEKNDVAGKDGVLLGGKSITTDGLWAGQWTKLSVDLSKPIVTVPPASALLLHFSATP